MAVEKGKRCLFVVHSKELVEQFADRLKNQFGVNSGVIMAGVKPDPSKAVQVASIMSLIRREAPPADILFIDESHRARSKTYGQIMEKYPEAKIVGLTATPFRGDGKGLDFFDTLVHPVRIQELINLGHLVKTKVYAPQEEVDLKKVAIKGGDFDQRELAARFSSRKFYQNVIDLYKKHAEGKKTICFNINVEHSKEMCRVFLDNGIRAAHVDGTTKKSERTAIVDGFRRGDYDVLCNIGVYTEGFDIPDTEVVILNRATRSLGMYIQMVGRGLRPADGKDHCLVLDFGGNTARHGLAEHYDWEEFTLKGVSKPRKEGEVTPMDPKKCGECGAINKPRADVCVECGSRFESAKIEVEVTPVKKMMLIEHEAQMVYKFKAMPHYKLKQLPLHLLRIAQVSKPYKNPWWLHTARASGKLPKDDMTDRQIKFYVELEEVKNGTDKLLATLRGK
jgi:superfamily II DNA or RNA helicase